MFSNKRAVMRQNKQPWICVCFYHSVCVTDAMFKCRSEQDHGSLNKGEPGHPLVLGPGAGYVKKIGPLL